jgi:hypothetical protein
MLDIRFQEVGAKGRLNGPSKVNWQTDTHKDIRTNLSGAQCVLCWLIVMVSPRIFLSGKVYKKIIRKCNKKGRLFKDSFYIMKYFHRYIVNSQPGAQSPTML